MPKDGLDGSRAVFRTARRLRPDVPGFLARYLCLDDFEPAARRTLPRQIYGYYAGSAETGAAFAGNRVSFERIGLVPRVLADVSRRSTGATLFGRSYAVPVGIAPMGLSGLATHRGDLVLAQAARDAGALMVASATSLIPLERLAAEGGARWFQCYLPGEAERIEAMMDRVLAAGYETVVLTADVAVPANREGDLRNGFAIPLEPSLRLVADGLSHPRWSVGTFLRTLLDGVPHFENMDAGRGPAILSRSVVRDIGRRDALSWSHVAIMRRRWPGKLVIKGILHPEDVARARDAGADGVWISNHGGRQLDGAVAPLTILPEARRRAGDMAVLVDGGLRRGTDVLKALALGADFAFIGRPFLFAAAAAGRAGVERALRLIAEEIDRDMALLGIDALSQLGTAFLCHRERSIIPGY